MKHQRALSILLAALLLLSVIAAPAAAAGSDPINGEESLNTEDQSGALTVDGGEIEPYSPEDGEEPETDEDESGEAEEETETEPPFEHVISPIPLKKSGHTAYMDGTGDGRFQPDAGLSRAQAAQILYSLLQESCEITTEFRDVKQGAWYYTAVNTLASLGVLQGYDGLFNPDRIMTRAEFAAMVSRFEALEEGDDPGFPDLDSGHWAYRYLVSTNIKGWLTGDNWGNLNPDAVVTRAQAAVIMNRVLGRSPDKDIIDANPDMRIYIENLQKHWAYYDIMEAAVTHTESVLPGGEKWLDFEAKGFSGSTGFYFIDGYLYYFSSRDGSFIRSGSVGNFDFDSDGRYTTGNVELDGYLHQISLEIFTNNMTQEQKLRAAYLYTRDSFTYLRRNYYEVGATGWEMDEALTMFRTKYGNCYCYAAAFYYLSRWIGYDSIIIAGKVGSNNADHGWVEISFDGVLYMFDPELEMARLRDGRQYFDLYKFTYENAPWRYVRAQSDLAFLARERRILERAF